MATEQMEVHNHSGFTIEQIKELEYITQYKDNWRQRHVVLRKHPTDDKMIIADGQSFDRTIRVITCEHMNGFTRALSGAKEID